MGRMSDTKLAELCRTYKLHRVEGDKAKAEIMAELDRRGVAVGTEVESMRKHGLTLRKKARTLRFYSVAALKKLLPPALRKSVIYEAVRVGTLDELVKGGQLSADDVKSCLDHVDTTEPYIDVRLLKG